MNKPKPAALKRLEGNPGKRPINDSIKPAIGLITCPRPLTGPAKAEWNRIVPELQVLGLLTKIDRAAIAAYCSAYGRWIKAERELARIEKERTLLAGMISITSNGNAVLNPLQGVINKNLEMMHKFLTEFGMTPSSRTRISAPTQGTRDEMEDLLDSNREN